MVVPSGDNFFSFSLFHLRSESHLSLFLSVLDLGLCVFDAIWFQSQIWICGIFGVI